MTGKMTGNTTTATLERVIGLLTWAYDVADAEAGDDLHSPWASLACSIDLVAAWLQKHIVHPPEPVQAAHIAAALEAARDDLVALQPEGSLTLSDLVITRTWIATALARAEEVGTS